MRYNNCYIAIVWGGSLWTFSPLFVEAEIAPKWYLVVLGVGMWLLVWLLFVKQGKRRGRLMQCDKRVGFSWVALVMVLATFSQAVYAGLQGMGLQQGHNGFEVVGSFDNPAGVASVLAFSVPFAVYCLRVWRHWAMRVLVGVILAVVCVVLVWSESRAGMLSIGVVGIGLLIAWFSAFRFNGFQCAVFQRVNRRWRGLALLVVSVVVLTMGIVGGCILYEYKKDSADGRLLIWRCTAEMIANKPLLGHGRGGFEANYMNYQARYFEQHPNSRYAMLADSVNQPFNEYLRLLADYGVVGGMVLVVFAIWVAKAYRRRRDVVALYALLTLLSIAVFSLFSYPFRYPHTWIVGGVAVWMLWGSAVWSWSVRRGLCWLRWWLGNWIVRGVCCMALLCVLGYTITQMRAEVAWCRTAHQAMSGNVEEYLPRYQRLMRHLGNNRLFLYNYAAELNVAGQYKESLRMAHECEKRWADYDLQMMMADSYQKLQQYREAEARYRKAAFMCPVKFFPLYKLYQLHVMQGEQEKAQTMARKISEKPVKVYSPEVMSIKHEMEQLLQ